MAPKKRGWGGWSKPTTKNEPPEALSRANEDDDDDYIRAAGAPWEARARAARVQTAGEDLVVVVVVVVRTPTPSYLRLASSDRGMHRIRYIPRPRVLCVCFRGRPRYLAALKGYDIYAS
jgi:hypothetical protein